MIKLLLEAKRIHLLLLLGSLIIAVLASGCVGQQGLNNTNTTNYTNYTNYTDNANYTNYTGPEYVNCTASQPTLITTIENPAYSPEYEETEPYLRQISESSGENISLTGRIKSRTLAEGTKSEWWYVYLETDNDKEYILNGRHWSGFPNFEYGNFHAAAAGQNVKVKGQKVTIYPMGKDEKSYGQYGPQDGILITSVEGYEPACCYQKLQSGGYSPLICLWK